MTPSKHKMNPTMTMTIKLAQTVAATGLCALILGMVSTLSAAAGNTDIGEQREIEMGDELAVSLLGGAKLLNSDAAQEYVNEVGRWLTLGTERVDLPWQFGIMNRSEIGAYPLPGGKVLVTLGMLKQLKTESELAAVLAHEIAHILKRHQLQSLAGVTAQTNLGAITVALPPALEFEADRMAVVILARAGYDPAAYLTVLRRLQNDRSSDAGLAMLSAVHPPFGERIAQLQPVVQRVGASLTLSPTEPQRARFATAMATVRTPTRQ
jgi:predicted Zn-dependent protease